jgi:hypothetical protein
MDPWEEGRSFFVGLSGDGGIAIVDDVDCGSIVGLESIVVDKDR